MRETNASRSRTHGKDGTSLYRAWENMIQRCTNPKNKSFPNYGGRGVRVCERWLDFSNFLADMPERPSPEHTIDRQNNDGHYEPSNVRWATRTEQNRNRRPRADRQGVTP